MEGSNPSNGLVGLTCDYPHHSRSISDPSESTYESLPVSREIRPLRPGVVYPFPADISAPASAADPINEPDRSVTPVSRLTPSPVKDPDVSPIHPHTAPKILETSANPSESSDGTEEQAPLNFSDICGTEGNGSHEGATPELASTPALSHSGDQSTDRRGQSLYGQSLQLHVPLLPTDGDFSEEVRIRNLYCQNWVNSHGPAVESGTSRLEPLAHLDSSECGPSPLLAHLPPVSSTRPSSQSPEPSSIIPPSLTQNSQVKEAASHGPRRQLPAMAGPAVVANAPSYWTLTFPFGKRANKPRPKSSVLTTRPYKPPGPSKLRPLTTITSGIQPSGSTSPRLTPIPTARSTATPVASYFPPKLIPRLSRTPGHDLHQKAPVVLSRPVPPPKPTVRPLAPLVLTNLPQVDSAMVSPRTPESLASFSEFNPQPTSKNPSKPLWHKLTKRITVTWSGRPAEESYDSLNLQSSMGALSALEERICHAVPQSTEAPQLASDQVNRHPTLPPVFLYGISEDEVPGVTSPRGELLSPSEYTSPARKPNSMVSESRNRTTSHTGSAVSPIIYNISEDSAPTASGPMATGGRFSRPRFISDVTGLRQFQARRESDLLHPGYLVQSRRQSVPIHSNKKGYLSSTGADTPIDVTHLGSPLPDPGRRSQPISPLVPHGSTQSPHTITSADSAHRYPNVPAPTYPQSGRRRRSVRDSYTSGLTTGSSGVRPLHHPVGTSRLSPLSREDNHRLTSSHSRYSMPYPRRGSRQSQVSPNLSLSPPGAARPTRKPTERLRFLPSELRRITSSCDTSESGSSQEHFFFPSYPPPPFLSGRRLSRTHFNKTAFGAGLPQGTDIYTETLSQGHRRPLNPPQLQPPPPTSILKKPGTHPSIKEFHHGAKSTSTARTSLVDRLPLFGRPWRSNAHVIVPMPPIPESGPSVSIDRPATGPTPQSAAAGSFEKSSDARADSTPRPSYFGSRGTAQPAGNGPPDSSIGSPQTWNEKVTRGLFSRRRLNWDRLADVLEVIFPPGAHVYIYKVFFIMGFLCPPCWWIAAWCIPPPRDEVRITRESLRQRRLRQWNKRMALVSVIAVPIIVVIILIRFKDYSNSPIYVPNETRGMTPNRPTP
ncbi:hypothetical protein H4R33_001452 [Dimargaris cristalligena]|nr:hypothetical protein H4R33_001452 [Dimargaris cristalligena]